MSEPRFESSKGVVVCYYDDPVRGRRKTQRSIGLHAGDEEAAREYLRAKVAALTDTSTVGETLRELSTGSEASPSRADPGAPASCVELASTTTAAGASASPALSQFKPNLPPLDETGFTMCLFGSSKSGKTYLMTRRLMRDPRLDNKDVISFLISPSIHSKTYKDIPNDVIKLSAWEPSLLRILHRLQRATDNKYAFVLYLDDVITAKNDRSLMEAFLTLRNSKISTVLLLQSTMLLNRNSRFNVNHVIGLRNNSDEASRQSLDFFFGSYKPFYGIPPREQIRRYRDMTSRHNFIHLDCLDGTLTHCAAAAVGETLAAE